MFWIAAASIIGLIFLALSANNFRQHRSLYGRLLTDGISATATVLDAKKKRRSVKATKGSSQRRHVMLVTYEFLDNAGTLQTTTVARWLDQGPLLRKNDRVEIIYDPRSPQVNAPRDGLERHIYGQHGAIWWLLPLVALYLIVWLLRYLQWRMGSLQGNHTLALVVCRQSGGCCDAEIQRQGMKR